MSRIVPLRLASSRAPPRATGGPAVGVTVGLVALAFVAQKLCGPQNELDLRAIADEAPALILREEAVLALAEEGDASVVPDLVAMLDERNLSEMRLAADAALERLVGRAFGANESAARQWLEQSGRSRVPATSVGGRDRADWPAELRSSGELAARVVARGDDVLVSVGAPLPAQFNLVLDVERGALVMEVSRAGEAYVVQTRDVPDAIRSLDRHAPIRATIDADGALTFALPRLGCLASASPPRALHAVVPSEPETSAASR